MGRKNTEGQRRQALSNALVEDGKVSEKGLKKRGEATLKRPTE